MIIINTITDYNLFLLFINIEKYVQLMKESVYVLHNPDTDHIKPQSRPADNTEHGISVLSEMWLDALVNDKIEVFGKDQNKEMRS